MMMDCTLSSFFFFNDTATTEIYTLSLHDALPIFFLVEMDFPHVGQAGLELLISGDPPASDRKSTRLNSSHLVISYAVFCLKKKSDTPRRVLRLASSGHGQAATDINPAAVLLSGLI